MNREEVDKYLPHKGNPEEAGAQLIEVFWPYHIGGIAGAAKLALICTEQIIKSFPTRMEFTFSGGEDQKEFNAVVENFTAVPFWLEVQQYLQNIISEQK